MSKDEAIELAALFKVLTLREAADWWGKSSHTIYAKLMSEERRRGMVLMRQSGATWLTTMEALVVAYGQPTFPRPKYD